jgi:rfaE bifunctional protein nucleotidyltransferase chain/domain
MNRSRKIKRLAELEEILNCERIEGKRIVLCHGVFDLVHPGHVLHFKAARELGDLLVVTVTPDRYVNKGPGRPVFSEQLRVESLAALEYIDYVAINEWPTSVETIHQLRPDVYVKGSDYADPAKDLTGAIDREDEAIKSVGGRIRFTNELSFSSTELLNSYFGVYPEEAQLFLREFRVRYSFEDVIRHLEGIKKLKVLVVGDTIIDEYYYCQAIGKSPKETIVSTRYLREEAFAGGILACANHIAGFCDDVHLVTCLGTTDSKEEFVVKHLKPNVKAKFFYRSGSCTVVKRRFVDPAFLSKMFEICFLDDGHLSHDIDEAVCSYLGNCVGDYDLVLVADYGHGFIGRKIVNVLCEGAKFLAVNTQTNSANLGFNLITKYPRADYICIDEPEIRLATHDKHGNLEDLIVNIASNLRCKRISITRGHLGSVTYGAESGFFHAPVFSREIIDRVGAGDAYFSIAAPCVASGYSMDLAGFIGNAVGALAVGIVCNRSPIEPVPLFKFITSLLK